MLGRTVAGNTVELFQIRCETCRARLRVSDPRVLGQIHACPKCGSMVQIVPPAGWVAPAEVAAAVPLVATHVGPGSSIAFPNTESVAAAAAPASKFPVAIASLFHSTAVWCSAGSIAALAVVGLGASLAWHGSSNSTVPPPPAAAEASATAPVAAKAEAKPESGVCQGLVAAMDKQSEIDFAADDIAGKETAANKTAAIDPVDSAATTATATVPPSTPLETAPATNVLTPFDAQVESVPQPEPSRTLKLEAVSADPTPGAVQNSSSRAIAESSGIDSDNIATNNLPPAETAHALLRFGPSTQDAAHRTNIADQVSMPIKSFDMADAPLSRALETLANMAAVQITVDPAVLSAARVSSDAKVTVHAHDTTIGRLIGNVLREHNLACEMRDGQVVVVARPGDTAASAQ
jgi:hypothetical protein